MGQGFRPSTITYMKTSLRRIDDFNGGLMISMGPSPSKSYRMQNWGGFKHFFHFHPFKLGETESNLTVRIFFTYVGEKPPPIATFSVSYRRKLLDEVLKIAFFCPVGR